MKIAVLTVALMAFGCIPAGGTGTDGGRLTGQIPVQMDFGHGVGPGGLPVCQFGVLSTKRCAIGQNLAWLEYKDGTGEGCLADGVGTHNVNEGPGERWSAYEFCARGPVESEAPGCACEDDARCEIPRAPFASSPMVVAYDAAASGIPGWTVLSGNTPITQAGGGKIGLALCSGREGTVPSEIHEIDADFTVLSSACFNSHTGEQYPCFVETCLNVMTGRDYACDNTDDPNHPEH